MRMMQEKKAAEKGHQMQTQQVWDCGSSLYDSFELKTFERQLDSAITSSRSLSMPHLSSGGVGSAGFARSSSSSSSSSAAADHHHHQPPFLSKKPAVAAASRISRSVYKLIRSFFKTNSKQSNSRSDDDHFYPSPSSSKDRFYVVYDSSAGSLSTIPEAPELVDALSPEIRSLVTRASSDRFTAPSAATTSIGIFCAR